MASTMISVRLSDAQNDVTKKASALDKIEKEIRLLSKQADVIKETCTTSILKATDTDAYDFDALCKPYATAMEMHSAAWRKYFVIEKSLEEAKRLVQIITDQEIEANEVDYAIEAVKLFEEDEDRFAAIQAADLYQRFAIMA